MSLTVDRNALRRAKQRVKRIGERSADPSPAWPRVGSYLSNTSYRQFVTKGSYYGTPWKPLKPDYAHWKLQHGYGRTMLVLTGKLKASLVSRPMSVEEYRGKSAVFGTDNRLAVFHQYGTHRNGKPVLPARPIVVVTSKISKDIQDIFTEYILTGRIATVKGRI